MHSPNTTRRQALKTFALTLALGALAACSPDTLKFKSIDITGADYAKGFELADHNGAQRTLADFKGKVVVVFFGFTQCPDVCPTALTDLAEVKRLLGPQGDKLQGIFVSVDPERDTPEVLKAYMANFDPGFLAMRPTPAQLPEVARAFKIFYKKVEGQTPTSYTMEHSAGSYVFDTQGRVRLYTRPAIGAQGLAEDIALLLK
ncbi:MAG: SCO family protein [Polaromonas sp.]|jgi:protein SCO1/2|nr:SCO family protein [Polaromonas sp.]MBP8087179.1 SCO family protein [Polaromonas sp.]